VVGILPTIPENISLFGRIRKWFNPNTQTTNADLARELAQVYRKFRDRARDVQQMFRLAEPKDLSEMYTPMDAMRSLRDLLSVEEMRFYQERTAVPVARRAAGD
jgi:hypothetical protein